MRTMEAQRFQVMMKDPSIVLVAIGLRRATPETSLLAISNKHVFTQDASRINTLYITTSNAIPDSSQIKDKKKKKKMRLFLLG